MESGSSDGGRERARFGGVPSVDYEERIARTVAVLQDDLLNAWALLPGRDLMIAATAIEVDDVLVVADGDLDTDPIRDRIDVTHFDPLPSEEVRGRAGRTPCAKERLQARQYSR